MSGRHGWLIALVIAALLVSACGPVMATPTPPQDLAEGGSPSAAPAEDTSPEPADKVPTPVEEEPTKEPEPPAVTPEEQDDWRTLGAPDAPVTIIEYSDFQ